MGLLSALAGAIYREYDRRIKRASVITEYGVQHHDHSADQADETQAAPEQMADHAEEAPPAADHAGEEAAEIVNIPRGTPVAHEPAPEASPEPTE